MEEDVHAFHWFLEYEKNLIFKVVYNDILKQKMGILIITCIQFKIALLYFFAVTPTTLSSDTQAMQGQN